MKYQMLMALINLIFNERQTSLKNYSYKLNKIASFHPTAFK